MDDIEKILQQFRLNVTAFLDELVDKFPKEEWLIRDRVYFTTRTDTKEVLDSFVWYLLKCREAIIDRDDRFFLNGDGSGTFMEKLVPEHYKQVKKIWRSGVLDDVDRETIWRWVDAFVFFADRYKKCIQEKNTFVSKTPIALPSISQDVISQGDVGDIVVSNVLESSAVVEESLSVIDENKEG